MVKYRFSGQYVNAKQGCGGCGTARVVRTLNTIASANVQFPQGRLVQLVPNQIMEFSDDEATQIEAWNSLIGNQRLYHFIKMP